MTGLIKRFIVFIILFALVSCTTPSTPILTPAETNPPVAVSSPIMEPSPTAVPPTATTTPVPPTLTDTPLPPTATNTPAPSSLNPDGPYVMFSGTGGIWISNPDGSFLTRLSDYHIWSAIDLHRLVSPTGDRMALVVSNEQGLDLQIINITSDETITVTHLIDSNSQIIIDPISPKAFATYAIRDYDSLAWQPGDGRLLAFTAAINGPTSDLYTYDTQTGEITQLTSGPAQAVMPFWSPDGQYILHFGVSWVPPFGGAIGGANQLDGVWAVRVSDGEIISLPKNLGSNPHFLGWQDNTHYITYDSGDCESDNLRSVDILTGKSTALMDASFYSYIDQSPENGAIIFSSAPGCPDSLGEGIFLLPAGQTDPVKLWDVRAWEVDWMPESGIFDAYPEGLFTSDGQTHYDTPSYNNSFNPAVSKLGYQAWEILPFQQTGRAVVKVGGGGWQTVLDGTVDALIWDPVRGDTLLIAMNDGSLYSATYPDFFPQLMGDLDGTFNEALWVP